MTRTFSFVTALVLLALAAPAAAAPTVVSIQFDDGVDRMPSARSSRATTCGRR